MTSTCFTIYLEPYYNSILQTYQEIITVDCMPPSPISNRVSMVKCPRLSPFSNPKGCVLTFLHSNSTNLMTKSDLPELFSFLLDHDCHINTDISQIISYTNKSVIAYITKST